MATVTQITAPANDGKEATEGAKKIKRLVYQALEDYYDDTTKRYREGHSDASVAKETGAAEKFVSAIRENDFGPLSEPDEIVALRGEVSKVVSEVGKLQSRLADLCKRMGWSA